MPYADAFFSEDIDVLLPQWWKQLLSKSASDWLKSVLWTQHFTIEVWDR
jgi:hypothetical protein